MAGRSAICYSARELSMLDQRYRSAAICLLGESMNQRRAGTRLGTCFVVAVAVVAAAAHEASAGCNLIPGTVKTFNSALGATNRPFAAPGETIELRVRPCDTPASLGMDADDHVVTVIFTPPSGARYAKVLTADADCATNIDAKLSDCAMQLSGGTATCVNAAQSRLAIVDRDGVPHLSFRFPDTDAEVGSCLGGTNDGLPCLTDSNCPGMGATCVPDNSDDHTLAGAATIAVTGPLDDLPCQLASSTCASQPGLIACIGDFFANYAASGPAVASGTFPHFTALPPPNDYRTDCFSEGGPL